ncbi:MAG TPA: DUF3300 domain-containing protein [Steroidobacteraceae bacterium]|nr:DUF3300 domain-containing protein [Steroidobacteraceae bacterium]
MVEPGAAQPQAADGGAPGSVPLTAAQIDQLTAPIALYPDELLGSILVASTYPLELVEAARWLEDPTHAALKDQDLTAALDQQPWDPSVKSLVPFPDVLRQMNTNLEWTEQLGDAFLAQQGDVMDSVQRLRQRARAQGALRSTPQQTVATEQNDITIEPANPDVVYVPYYVPTVVYGPWPWPDYPPYYFVTPPGVFLGGAVIGFGIGIGIFEPPWGWYGLGWPQHGVVVYPRRPPHPRPGPQPGSRPWHHDVAHRRGVPYRDSATAARYLGAEAAARRPFRGFPASSAGRAPPPPVTGRGVPPPPAPQPPGARERLPGGIAPAPIPRPFRAAPARPAAPAQRPMPPAFESFGRGPQVRNEATRGFSSRSAPTPSPANAAGGHPGHR